ncbi:hypothetical protein IDSA_05160 [Pseudidiomarina salinarum]|uniref:Uncharacterized protein n=1 Tax=Pseudidiomarina salinarum TaxID=435908 RepID=A0A094LB02_9GAMM|nr:hypothetical protein [Pseudidiomarina salinarum]KFZ32063.1 hypothetical protein IDSA_05160 [Pseudidiomarina salinarum]RUO70158.1 hypothetical protein CWI79_01425 [Pseudidiomarina salinarum]
MNINMTLVGQGILLIAIIFGLISYYLGRRKTTNPVIAGFIGFVLSLVPLLGIIYLAILVLKKDVNEPLRHSA